MEEAKSKSLANVAVPREPPNLAFVCFTRHAIYVFTGPIAVLQLPKKSAY